MQRNEVLAVLKMLDQLTADGWFRQGLALVNLQGHSLYEMQQRFGRCVWDADRLFSHYPEAQTSRYRWELRRVDQLRNLYVWQK